MNGYVRKICDEESSNSHLIYSKQQQNIIFSSQLQKSFREMGQNPSIRLKEFQTNYTKISEEQNLYFGSYQILQNIHQHHRIIHKFLTLTSHQEAKTFKQSFSQEQKIAFYVLYPQAVEFSYEEGLCSKTESVHVFLKNNLTPLKRKMEMDLKKFGMPMKQAQIWFILNELSRSLEILHLKKHPHLCLDPENIYFNKNQNWFIYDSYYVNGSDFQGKECVQNRLDFMRRKVKKNYLVSENMKASLQKNTFSIQTFLEEDIYCLGFTVLYLMTFIHPNYLQGKLNPSYLLKNCSSSYSKKLLRLINSMIEEVNTRRISLKSIRERLKHDEKNIINEEQQEYRKLIGGSRNRLITDYPRQPPQTFLSPPLPFQSMNSTKTKAMYRSPPSDHHRAHFQSPPHIQTYYHVPRPQMIRDFNFSSPSK